MFGITACKQLTYAAALLALALLCAQTEMVIHDHQVSDNELCAVCSAPAQHERIPQSPLDTIGP